jgi:molybdate transport system substrate-binding protein
MKRHAFRCLAILLAACGADEDEVIDVYAASSIGPALEDVARSYRASTVRVTAAGSQILERQIDGGAPADVFVPASAENIERLGERLGSPRELICNRLVIAVSPDSPVRSLADLPRAERLVLGAPEAPIGAYTDEMLSRARRVHGASFSRDVTARVVSREMDVRMVLSKVLLGEADAAIVYRTDAIAAGERVRTIEIDPELAPVARYPIAIVSEADPRASDLVEHLFGEGAAVLLRHGFSRCPEAHPE